MIGQMLLNRYRIDTLLGQGGTSDVFKSFDLTLQRPVAVKMLTRSVDIADRAYERFLREAQHTSRLSHPNIVSIFDYGVFEGTNPFLVTEYLNGPTMQDILDSDGKFATTRALAIFRQIAEGLSHAHNTGIIHRDVKPSNILLVSNIDGSDFVKIIDFGFVHVIAPGNEMQKLTLEDGILGSAFYVSPEQCSGKAADERSDIYSLGCLMYECISGMVPICGTNLLETFQMHIHDEVQKLSEACEGTELPDGLETLIMSCLEKNPSNRPQTMKQVAASISQCLSGSTNTAKKNHSGNSLAAIPAAVAVGTSTESGKATQSAEATQLADAEINRSSVLHGSPSANVSHTSERASDISSNQAMSKSEPRNLQIRNRIITVAVILLGLSGVFATTYFSRVSTHNDGVSQNGASATGTPEGQIATTINSNSGSLGAENGDGAANSENTDGATDSKNTDGATNANSANRATSANNATEAAAGTGKKSIQKGKAAEVDHLVTLAKECHAQGKCDEALELMERSVQVSSKVYGPNSKETKARIKDLAVMYLTLGMQKEADQLMAKIGAM